MWGLVGKALANPGVRRMAGSALSTGTFLGTGAMGVDAVGSMIKDKENELILKGQNASGGYDKNVLDTGLQALGMFKSDDELTSSIDKKTQKDFGEVQALLQKYGDGGNYQFESGETGDKWLARNQGAILDAKENRAIKKQQDNQKWQWQNNPEFTLAKERMAQQDRMNMFAMQERMYERAHQRRRDTQNAMLGMGGALAAILSA